MGKGKNTSEPDLGRFNRGVNRPQPGSGRVFYLPIVPLGSLWAIISRPKIGLLNKP